MNAKQYKQEAVKIARRLSNNKDMTEDELKEFVRNIPLVTLQNGTTLGEYVVSHNLSLRDMSSVLAYAIKNIIFLNSVKVSSDISFDEVKRYYELAQTNTIVIHRANYFLHEAMIVLYDILEKEKRLRFAAKKAYNETEKAWTDYNGIRKRIIEKTAWYTLQDHLRLSNNAVNPYLEKVYEAVRDHMIRLRMKDIEVKARCVQIFLLGKVCGHSFKAFFRDFEKESGVDFSKCFEDDDMQPMMGHFADLADAIGVKAEKDKYGYWQIEGYDPEKSQRFAWAWEDFMKALRNDDLMDEAAKNAIDLNPAVQEEYRHILEEEERKHVLENVDKLSDRFKVSRK